MEEHTKRRIISTTKEAHLPARNKTGEILMFAGNIRMNDRLLLTNVCQGAQSSSMHSMSASVSSSQFFVTLGSASTSKRQTVGNGGTQNHRPSLRISARNRRRGYRKDGLEWRPASPSRTRSIAGHVRGRWHQLGALTNLHVHQQILDVTTKASSPTVLNGSNPNRHG
jgi:hypothetical protein